MSDEQKPAAQEDKKFTPEQLKRLRDRFASPVGIEVITKDDPRHSQNEGKGNQGIAFGTDASTPTIPN